MALSRTRSAAVYGIEAHFIDVEVDMYPTDKRDFITVGMPDTAVRESRERIKSALTNSGFRYPPMSVTINLAPANVRKEGAGFDLPMALGILGAMGVVALPEDHLFVGELSLDGSLRPVRGTLSIAVAAQKAGIKNLVVPTDNGAEAAIAGGVRVFALPHLSEVVNYLRESGGAPTSASNPKQSENADWFDKAVGPAKSGTSGTGVAAAKAPVIPKQEPKYKPLERAPFVQPAPTAKIGVFDFAEVRGQTTAKRALEVAAAGGHNVLMIGPPGSGKTMLAKRFSGILPPLTFEEAIQTTQIHSIAGALPKGMGLLMSRPYRSPHHTVSEAGLVGGGIGVPRPGEVSLAHHGVLFLDELPEFQRNVLELLRQPLEDREVTIARSAMTLSFPASFVLVAAMNPCPCGFFGDTTRECRCTGAIIARYLAKLSGPLLDRIDLHIEVPAVPYQELRSKDKIGNAPVVSTAQIRERVCAAREIQQRRGFYNSLIPSGELHKLCELDSVGERTLEMAVRRMGLSARAHDRILKVARTVADLDHADRVSAKHLAEAVQYRSLDRNYWQ
jgi:magnesium chelatase family protein